ncbi:MAG: site-2 protease family protein, partial [Pirellulales bacterium]|nr:site-2 protease family protein [Pirellulales bacterium]
AAVQQDSPAAIAGVQPGDFLLSMNGDSIGDPIEWPDRVRKLAQSKKWIALEVNRPSKAGKEELVTLEMMPRIPDWLEAPQTSNTPMSCPALGIAYHVVNFVHRVVPNSPADKAGIRSLDEIIRAEIIKGQDDPRAIEYNKIEFSEEARNWPLFIQLIQSISPQSEILLTVKRHDEEQKITLKPYIPDPAGDGLVMYYPYRGFELQAIKRVRYARSIREGLRMGWDKTVESLGMVYRFLSKIGGQVPLTAMGGPIMIAKVSYFSVLEGAGQFLVFLTILSANLAVLNFLPIPLLDGGHMLFLAYEGIRGRPPRERFVVALHMIGFVFIIGLMLFVFALDLGLIPRNL